MNNKELKENLEKERKKQREDAIKINTFIRLDKSSASEIEIDEDCPKDRCMKEYAPRYCPNCGRKIVD